MSRVSSNEYAKEGYHPTKAILAHLPGEHFALDLAGTFPRSSNRNIYLMVLVDLYTRFVLLDALENKNAPTVAKTLVRRFSDVGFPKVLQSENGKEYNNTDLLRPIALAKMASQKIA